MIDSRIQYELRNRTLCLDLGYDMPISVADAPLPEKLLQASYQSMRQCHKIRTSLSIV